eukprot:TRINITY_DN67814_c0_g2_i1.p2 TRINITY_DN67814_c0_g2~~TRINITY_DN67814_c0_g2_i1.p2  ORF type:complete len:116 (-),score=12.62 TRINITY_DN67814_c0_g2_i1:128-475(-)
MIVVGCSVFLCVAIPLLIMLVCVLQHKLNPRSHQKLDDSVVLVVNPTHPTSDNTSCSGSDGPPMGYGEDEDYPDPGDGSVGNPLVATRLGLVGRSSASKRGPKDTACLRPAHPGC